MCGIGIFNEKYENVYTLNRSDGDLFDFEFVRNFVDSVSPDIIIHCIADTNLKRCEENKNNTLFGTIITNNFQIEMY